MALEQPGFLQQLDFPAEQTRRIIYCLLARNASGDVGSVAGGIIADADYEVTPPGSGMSVNVATGELICPGTDSTTQSGYYVRSESTNNVSITAASPSNPRVDIVCCTVTDAYYAGGDTNQAALQSVEGTPTSGATLENLDGAPSLPGDSYLIAYVLVPANATSITSGDILNVGDVVEIGIGTGTPSNVVVVEATGTELTIGTANTWQTVATYTPAATGLFLVQLYALIPSGGADLGFQATYADTAGAETLEILPVQSQAAGPWSSVGGALIAAHPGTAINVQAQSSSTSTIVSAAIEAL